MSRRFGRQQRRRLTKQINDLEAKVVSLKHQLDELREIAKRNRRIVEDTANLLGRYFITFDPTDIELARLSDLADEWRVQHYNFSIYDHRSAFEFSSASAFMERSISAIQGLPVMKCKAFLDEIRGAVHFRFTFNGKTAGYAISQSAIMQNQGFKEAARNNVAEAVTRLFMDTGVSR